LPWNPRKLFFSARDGIGGAPVGVAMRAAMAGVTKARMAYPAPLYKGQAE